jgi:hypothetical protein
MSGQNRLCLVGSYTPKLPTVFEITAFSVEKKGVSAPMKNRRKRVKKQQGGKKEIVCLCHIIIIQ